MEDWKFPHARCARGPRFQSMPPPDACPTRPGTALRFHQAPDVRDWERRVPRLAGSAHYEVGNKPAWHWSHQYRRPESFFEVPPAAAVAFEKFVGLLRSPSSGRIIGEITWRECFPEIQHRIYHRPARFHHIRTLKQSLIADHTVVQQPLVPCTGLLSKVFLIFEVHVHCAEAHDRTGNFSGEL